VLFFSPLTIPELRAPNPIAALSITTIGIGLGVPQKMNNPSTLTYTCVGYRDPLSLLA